MIRFENTIEISRPIEEVFRFIADFEHIPLWNYYVLSVRQLSDGRRGVGTVYHQVRKSDAQDYQIVDFQPNHRVGVKTLPGSRPALERVITLEETHTGSRITDVWELDTGLNGLVERLGAGRIKAAVAGNLDKLKELLERGQTRLQDGRISRL
jgi:uncharacterized membrane protein